MLKGHNINFNNVTIDNLKIIDMAKRTARPNLISAFIFDLTSEFDEAFVSISNSKFKNIICHLN